MTTKHCSVSFCSFIGQSLAVAVGILVLGWPAARSEAAQNGSPRAKSCCDTPSGRTGRDPQYFFPIAVWLQDPRNAASTGRRASTCTSASGRPDRAADRGIERPACRSSASRMALPDSTWTRRPSSAGCTATNRTTPSRWETARATARRSRRRRSSRTTSRSERTIPPGPCC